jgi:microcystin-dependent protein
MTQPYLGEIQIYGFNFPPSQWAFCGGQLMAISQNTALFSLFGTNFGGNGTTTFGLPDLASQMACAAGQGPGLTDRVIGESFGTQTEALQINEMPAHPHQFNDFIPGDSSHLVATPTNVTGYGYPPGTSFKAFAAQGQNQPVGMHPTMVQPAGNSQGHENRQPFLGLNFSVALRGVFPSFN